MSRYGCCGLVYRLASGKRRWRCETTLLTLLQTFSPVPLKFYIFLFAIISFGCVNAQSTDNIEQIRETVEKINTDTGYRTRTLDNEEFMEEMGDGGGSLTGYYKGD